MNKPICLAVACLGLAILGGQSASAQNLQAPSAPRAPRPTLSPYLNLLDRNNSQAFNYYNRVRPRQNFNDYQTQQFQNLSRLRREVDANQRNVQSLNSQLQPSGHQTRFLDYGGYFPTGPARPAGATPQFGGR